MAYLLLLRFLGNKGHILNKHLVSKKGIPSISHKGNIKHPGR